MDQWDTSHITPHTSFGLSDAVHGVSKVWNELSDNQREVLAGLCGIDENEPDISEMINNLFGCFNGSMREKEQRQKTFTEVVQKHMEEFGILVEAATVRFPSPPPPLDVFPLPFPFDEMDRPLTPETPPVMKRPRSLSDDEIDLGGCVKDDYPE